MISSILKTHVVEVVSDQGSSNIFVREPHKLLLNNSRAGHRLPVQNKVIPKYECCLIINAHLLKTMVKSLL